MSRSTPTPGEGFRKQHFTARSFLAVGGQFVWNIPGLIRAVRADRVDDQFAEKIMLAVTAVNECRYCARFHTDVARQTGVDQETIDRILDRDIEAAVDETERAALVFALQYAEAEADPSPAAVAALREAYGPETAEDVLAFIRAIYFGNLAGNTVDAALFAVGRKGRRTWGLLESGYRSVGAALVRLRQVCPV